MTITADAPELPLTAAPAARHWRVTMADNTARTIEAPAFRIDGGALVLLLPAGCAAAYAPGTWLTIEEAVP